MQSNSASATVVAACVLVPALSLPGASQAIVLDVSRSPASAIAPNLLSDRYGGIGFVNTSCSGVPIARDAVISAAHCFDGTRGEFRLPLDDQPDVVIGADIVTHPDYDGSVTSAGDLAIMKLDSSLPETVPIYSVGSLDEAPVGQVVEVVGYGLTGTGITGEQAFGGGALGEVKRFGFNELDGVTNGGVTLTMDFDGNGENRTGSAGLGALESFPGFGDSGGPMFLGGFADPALEIGSQAWIDALYGESPLVLGIASFTIRFGAGLFGRYGSLSGHTYLAEYEQWISENAPGVIVEHKWPPAPVPLPSPLLLLFVTLGLVLPFVKRRNTVNMRSRGRMIPVELSLSRPTPTQR